MGRPLCDAHAGRSPASWARKIHASSRLPQQRAAPACLKLQSPPRRSRVPHPRCLHGFSSLSPGGFLSTQEPRSQPVHPKYPTSHEVSRDELLGLQWGLPAQPPACLHPALTLSWRMLPVPAHPQHPPAGMLLVGTRCGGGCPFWSPNANMPRGQQTAPRFAGLRCLQGKARENFHLSSQQHNRGRDSAPGSARRESGLLIIYASPPCYGDERQIRWRNSQITETRLQPLSPERPFIRLR